MNLLFLLCLFGASVVNSYQVFSLKTQPVLKSRLGLGLVYNLDKRHGYGHGHGHGQTTATVTTTGTTTGTTTALFCASKDQEEESSLSSLVPQSPQFNARASTHRVLRFASGLGAASIACLCSKIVRAEEDSVLLVREQIEQNQAKFAAEVENTRALNSDEFVVSFSNQGLGLKLLETYYQGFPIVSVKEVSDKFKYPKELISGCIVVKINDDKVDGLTLKTISEMIKRTETRPIAIKFRDPNKYFELLDSTKGAPRRVITSSYLPANARDPGAPEQIIKVERLAMPPAENRLRPSQMLDVLEVQYAAQILDRGEVLEPIVDSSARGTSAKSIYYVLGQQNGPPGTKLPPGWDLTLQGMVVGEKRRITLPYTLGYDRKGDSKLNIPPFTTLVYTVQLLSIT